MKIKGIISNAYQHDLIYSEPFTITSISLPSSGGRRLAGLLNYVRFKVSYRSLSSYASVYLGSGRGVCAIHGWKKMTCNMKISKTSVISDKYKPGY